MQCRELYIKQIYATIIAIQIPISLTSSMFYTAYLIPQLRSEPSFQDINKQTVQCFVAASGFCLMPIGICVETLLMDWLGRKKSMILISIFTAIIWLMTSMAGNMLVLLSARISASFFSSMAVSADLYVQEIAAEDYRCTLCSLFAPAFALGSVLIYSEVQLTGWRLAALINCVHTLVVAGLLTTVPETKYWYTMKKRPNDAAKSLKWFTDCDQNTVERRLLALQKNITVNLFSGERVRKLFQLIYLKRMILMFALLCVQSWTGYTSISANVVDYFDSMKTGYSGRSLGLIKGYADLAATFLFVFLANKFNRKSILIGCSLAMATVMFVVVTYDYFLRANVRDDYYVPMSWIPIGCVLLYCVGFNLGVNNLLWIIVCELFPTDIRNLCQGACLIVFSFCQISTVFTLPILLTVLGFDGLNVIYAISCLTLALLTAIFLPETKPVHLYQVN